MAACLRADGFKIVSYNLRHGACNENIEKVDLARQMDLIRGEKARFIALQEVEVGSSRTGGVDQPAVCAKLLGKDYTATFGKAIDFAGGGYGVALLSTEKPLSVERLAISDSHEDRMLLICEFSDCFVASTHFSVATERDRETALAAVRRRLRKGFGKPFFLCGDLNSTQDSKIIRGLTDDFEIFSPTHEATYIGRWKQSDSAVDTSRCIDYILCDKANAARYGVLKRVLGTAAAVAPSDHRPIVAELVIRPRKDPDEIAFVGGDWKSDRICRGLIPEPTSADFAKAKADWESFKDRSAAWGPAPDLGEANAPAIVSKTQLWVAPDGNDETGDGSKAKPFRGILRARDEVRKLKKGGLPTDGITVFVRGGTYPMAETIVFGSADGGEPGRPVLYCAAPGEVPVFDGGFRVTGWKDFKGPVKVADVKALGYTHFEPIGPRGFEVSRESTGALVTDFYLDGVRQLPAQWPNEGWLYFTCYGTNNVVGIELDDWTPWMKEKNLYAKMYPACFWADLTSPVTNLNPKTGMMSVYGRAQGHNQVIRKDCAFRFQNALAALDRADECVFDYADGKLYAWNPQRKDAVLSDFSKNFLYFWTAHDLEFRGLVFRYGRSDAVVADSSQRLTFRDCQFLGFGQNGIMARRMNRLTVDGCRFRDFGYHAMRIGAGDRKTLTPGQTFIQNCDVSHAGWWKADFAFAACVDGCGATLRWNRFHDVPAATIRLNGNDMMLASNVFERCDYEAGDNGAVDIYANPSHASRIIHNVFRDCGSKDRGFVEAGHAGVRFDDAVSNQIVYGNRFEGCSPTNNVEWGFGSIQINGGRNNTIENNLFVGGWRVASVSGWPMSKWTQYLSNKGVQEMLQESDWQGPLYAKRYPGIDKLTTMPLVNRYYRNVQVGTGRFTALMDGQTDARCNFAYREMPDEETLNANPLWDPLPPESALGPRRPVVSLPARLSLPLGYQLDISRYKVPTMETLYRIVDLLAQLGYTQFQLYTEHTFAYKGHEEVWCEASPMTPDEVRALDAYCAARGIELIPNQNSFGHLENWLRHPGYNDLAEAPKGGTTTGSYTLKYPMCLCPTDPRSAAFVAGLYDQLLPCFRSWYVNVGGDETMELKDDHKPGIGRSAAEIAKKGYPRVYLDFLKKIHGLLAERGHTMMFWGDIILDHPELIPDLPADVIALNWGYEYDHPFETQTAAFEKAGRRFFVCPGTSAWGTLSGRTDNMMANVDAAITAGERHGMSGVLLADWGDYGHPNPFLVAVPSLVYTAHRLRGEKLTKEALAAEIDKVLGCKVGAALLRYGNMYQKTGPIRGGGSYWFKVLTDAGSFERPDGMTDEVVAAAWRELAAAQKEADLAGSADWVKDGFRMMDLLFEAVRLRLEQPKMRNFRAMFEPEYRKLWLKYNRLGGLETSLVYLFGPRR